MKIFMTAAPAQTFMSKLDTSTMRLRRGQALQTAGKACVGHIQPKSFIPMKIIQPPKWIMLFGALLCLVGFGSGMTGIVQPSAFFNDFPAFTQWPEIQSITAGWGVRSLGAGVAMAVALWLRSPGAIAAVYSMRLLTELGDLLVVFATGHGTMNLPLPALATVWVLLFLAPEALAARWGFVNACNPNCRI